MDTKQPDSGNENAAPLENSATDPYSAEIIPLIVPDIETVTTELTEPRAAAGIASGVNHAATAMITTVPNQRPERVDTLLYGGEVSSNWYFANRRANRFRIVNIVDVLEKLELDHTTARSYFRDANKEIQTNTDWYNQFKFEYDASHVQIYPDKLLKPKLFGHAATIIVALEFAARDKSPDLNVYDYLRILPIQYFADRLDADRLRNIENYFASLSPANRAERFGADSIDKTFEQTCLAAIEQEYSERLLSQIVAGYTITKYTAEKLVEFLNSACPQNLQIGPVRAAGDDAITEKLGYRNAAPSLHVPRRRAPSDLPPCA